MADSNRQRVGHRHRALMLGLYIWLRMPLPDLRTSHYRRRGVALQAVRVLSRHHLHHPSTPVRQLHSAERWMGTFRSPPSKVWVFRRAATRSRKRKPSHVADGSSGFTSLGRLRLHTTVPVPGAKAQVACPDNLMRRRLVGLRDCRRVRRRAAGLRDCRCIWFRRRDSRRWVLRTCFLLMLPSSSHRRLFIHPCFAIVCSALLLSFYHHILQVSICIISSSTSYSIGNRIAARTRLQLTMTDPSDYPEIPPVLPPIPSPVPGTLRRSLCPFTIITSCHDFPCYWRCSLYAREE